MTAPHTMVERIRGRLVEIEIGETTGIGWVAVGVVKEGLAHEKGLRFEATATSRDDAESRLQAEIGAYFG